MKTALYAILVGLMVSACGSSTGETSSGSKPAVASESKPREAKPSPPPPANLKEAIETARPHMSDTNNGDLDIGAAALALWGADRMKWSEIQALPTGKYAMVMKDSESQRGNKMCVDGQVIEIAVDNTVPGKKIFLGGIFDDGGRIVRFIAVHSTGEIVANSRARFCGVITGQQHYQNSVGGVAHAVHLVGMFDLAENKK